MTIPQLLPNIATKTVMQRHKLLLLTNRNTIDVLTIDSQQSEPLPLPATFPFNSPDISWELINR